MPPRDAHAEHATGSRALRRGGWERARARLAATAAGHESPETLEELGLAAWWLDDAPTVFDSRERAYALYRERGDARGAARVALWLVWDSLAFRGDSAVASGWLERARRLLADHRESPEYGWLLIREGEVALFRGHRPESAVTFANEAAALGRRVGDTSVEFTALALEGLARVSTGDLAGGMRRLDEASIAATSGEMKELHAVGVVCCWQIFACERVRDYDRAAQWCERVQEFTRRWQFRPLSAVCRTQYAGVLIWRGEWARAEEELRVSARELELVRPGIAGHALVRLGELRLRQGMLDDAERLFTQAGTSTASRVGLAAVLLERGNAAEAAATLERAALDVGDEEATLRAGALELLARAHAMLGDSQAAQRHLDELERLAARLNTPALMGSAAFARGIVASARGAWTDAARAFESAIERFERSGAPFEVARARTELARTYAALGRAESAEREARLSAGAMQKLRAAPESPKRGEALTPRQREILRFICQGMSNAEIATRLRLSDHTVKRHVANLLLRLDLPSRAAAAAYAVREQLV
ncbi:MAG TPA: LuxR C-terminal-related transcriptional regulator [Gemmatimonadaceae bacterium]|nr:LuxR C-terminal-related transcriptional regulator [Gemmatimonadaceae bacterium]